MAQTLSSCTSPVTMIPGLSNKKRLKQAGMLLRKPLAPKFLPPITNQEKKIQLGLEYCQEGSMMKLFESSFNLDALNNIHDDADIVTVGGSVDQSIVAPPPTSASPEKSFHNQKDEKSIKSNIPYLCPSPENDNLAIECDNLMYTLDSCHKNGKSEEPFFNGRSPVRSHKHRGPDPLPRRAPKKNPEIVPFYFVDDERYEQTPLFVFEPSVYNSAERRGVSQATGVIYSRHNVRKLTDLLARELNKCDQDTVYNHNFDTSNIPLKENRIPHRQILYEMAALMKEYVQEETGKNVKAVVKYSPKVSAVFSSGHHSNSEIFLFEDDSAQRVHAATRSRQETEVPGVDVVLTSAYSRYFQGSQRSRSPLSLVQDEAIAPSEMAVMDSLGAGGTTLSFCAHFIENLPDLCPLRCTLTHLNLCFNSFQNFPAEVLQLENLEVLQMRNNPLVEISADINRLKKLRVLVASFCLIASLPKSLFDLRWLEHLSLAYNRLTAIPGDICHLTSLQILDIEGNQIPALPAVCASMDKLTHVNVRNNLMHPVFWQENTKNQPQSLLDLAYVCVSATKQLYDLHNLPAEIANILTRHEVCSVCKGTLFGPGLRTIRPMAQLFSIKHLPLLFQACTPTCLNNFKRMSPGAINVLLYGE